MSRRPPRALGDPEIGAITVAECGEELVDMRVFAPEIPWSTEYDEPSGAFAHVRRGLGQRLKEAARALPNGAHLMLVEGHRPPQTQQAYFDEYAQQLVAECGALEGAELRRLASLYISPVDVAPHVAGGAIDLLLIDDGGTLLDMGTAINATPEETDGAVSLNAANISDEARGNREVLARALLASGLVNYPSEWWHWSYGDRYWAYETEAPAALYGPRSLRGSA